MSPIHLADSVCLYKHCLIFMLISFFCFQNLEHEWIFPLMTKREVIAFILMNLRLKSMTPTQRLKIVEALKKKKKHLKLNPRAVHLATIFTSNLLDSFSVCVGYVVPR